MSQDLYRITGIEKRKFRLTGHRFICWVVLLFITENVFSEELLMKINSEKSIQEIADNIELHAGTYNLSIIGSVKFNDFSKGLEDEDTVSSATIEVIAPHWVKKVDAINEAALFIFPLRIFILQNQDQSVLSFFNLRELLKSNSFDNEKLLDEVDNINNKFTYFLKTLLR